MSFPFLSAWRWAWSLWWPSGAKRWLLRDSSDVSVASEIRICNLCEWTAPTVVSILRHPDLTQLTAELEEQISQWLCVEHVAASHPEQYQRTTGHDPQRVLNDIKQLLDLYR